MAKRNNNRGLRNNRSGGKQKSGQQKQHGKYKNARKKVNRQRSSGETTDLDSVIDRNELADNLADIVEQVRTEHQKAEEFLDELLSRISADMPSRVPPKEFSDLIASVGQEFSRDANDNVKSMVRDFTQRIAGQIARTHPDIAQQLIPCKFCSQSNPPMISGCDCGQPMHYSCVCEWIAINGDQPCDVCGQKYNDSRIERISSANIWWYLFQVVVRDKQLVLVVSTIVTVALLRRLSLIVQFFLIIYAAFLAMAHYSGYREYRDAHQSEVRLHQWQPNDVNRK